MKHYFGSHFVYFTSNPSKYIANQKEKWHEIVTHTAEGAYLNMRNYYNENWFNAGVYDHKKENYSSSGCI